MKTARNITRGLKVLASLGLPSEQRNERSALCLLALLNLGRGDSLDQAEAPLIGITPIMEFALEQYGKKYAPNTRETFRRQTMHQFVEAGLALYNPDDPSRPVNSPKAVYQIEPAALTLILESMVRRIFKSRVSVGSSPARTPAHTLLGSRQTQICQHFR